jgi:hypothetical protein
MAPTCNIVGAIIVGAIVAGGVISAQSLTGGREHSASWRRQQFSGGNVVSRHAIAGLSADAFE